MHFVLNPKLENDTDLVCNLSLSQVRLHKNAAFPWLILIPRVANLIEWIDLSEKDELLLVQEIRQASTVLITCFNPTKLNVAALGNIVSQFHVHVIARSKEDKAWPNPVWNSGVEAHYDLAEKQQRIALLKQAFGK